MHRLPWAALVLATVIHGPSLAKPVPALYATKAEAEAAAKQHFHCTGAHQMGKQWMPCAKHADAAHHSGTGH
jgi:hypothetical protein